MYSYETIVKMYCTTSCWIVHAIANKSESVKYFFKDQWKLFWYVFQKKKKKLTTYVFANHVGGEGFFTKNIESRKIPPAGDK